MSIYNSQAHIKNTSSEVQRIGSITIDPDTSVLFWDTKNSIVNDTVWAIFDTIKTNHDVYTFPLIRDGYLQVIQDGISLDWEGSLAVLAQMYNQIEENNDISQLLSTGISLNESKDSRGLIKFVQESRLGSDLDVITHNLCDKTTWYTQSSRVTSEVPQDSGDGYRFILQNNYVIDMNHGKVYNEEKFAAEAEHKYEVIVRVDGYKLHEYSIFDPDDTHYDYTVSYRDGYIDFIEDHSGKSIEVDYSFANDSTWVLKANEGKSVLIERAEVQFSSDLEYNDAIDFEIWVYNPNDLPNKMLYRKTSYKSIHNFIDEAAGSYPVIPPIGGGALGKLKETYGFPFNYNTVLNLSNSSGVELRIKTRNNREFGGERATATFYCTVHDET